MLLKSIFYFFFCGFLYASPSYGGDSVLVCPAISYKSGIIHRVLFGKHYRTIWNFPVTAEILDIRKEKGGLRPVKKGGNWQTLNLRLANPEGKEYVLRLVVKDPTRGMPPFVRNSFLAAYIRDQNTAENPYAPLVVSMLSEGISIFHTNPRLVYVPFDTCLGEYLREFGGKLALFEERLQGNSSEDLHLGNSAQIVSTKKMLESVFEDSRYQVDQVLFLKCRLFDMFISDWGRHEDQWRWVKMEKEGRIIRFLPVPRDRDHALYLFDDGLIPWIYVTLINPKFQSCRKQFRNIEGLNRSAEFLDKRFLNRLSREQWMKMADSLTVLLTDSVISKAVHCFPDPVFDAIGEKTIQTLIYRRDHLKDVAGRYYSFLASEVEIAGTDQSEYFSISRVPLGKIAVTMMHGVTRDTLYHRIFDTKETQHLKIYGLGGNDTFYVQGQDRSGPFIDISGGEGTDVFTDASLVRGISKKNRFADNTLGAEVHATRKTRVYLSSGPSVNYYDREGYRKERKNKDREKKSEE